MCEDIVHGALEKIELLKLIECGFKHAGITRRPELVLAYFNALQSSQMSGAMEEWRKAPDTPAEVFNMDPRWFRSIYFTAQKMIMAADVRRRCEDLSARHKMFYEVLMLGDVCRRSPHAQLERFTALATDPVWKILREPFDWDCLCFVRAIFDADLPLDVDPFKPGIERLPRTLLENCVSWMTAKPRRIQGPLPQAPTRETRKWYPEPQMPREQVKAILKKYGIAVEIVHND